MLQNSAEGEPHLAQNNDYRQRNYYAAALDTPFALGKTVSINGTATRRFSLVHDQLFFSTRNGQIYSMRAADISDHAHKKAAEAISAPLLFRAPQLYITAVKGKDGLLQYDLIGRRILKKEKQEFSYSTPVVYQNLLFHAGASGAVYCFDARDEKLLWKSDMGGKINSNISFDGKDLFVLTQNGVLRCFTPRDGQINWSQQLDDSFHIPPLITESAVYCAGYGGKLFMLDKAGGELRQRLELGQPVLTPLSADEENLFITTSDGTLRCYNSDLTLKWQVILDAPLTIPVLVTDNMIIAGSSQRSLYILEKNRGTSLQRISLEGRPASLPVVYKNRLILAMEYEKIIELQVMK